MQRGQYSLGIFIIAIGILILIGKLGIISFAWKILWPLLIIAPGVLFHLLYFSRILPSGVLIPGGIFVTDGLVFLLCNIFGWNLMTYLWPGFIFGVAVGLYEYYLFDASRPRPAFVASIILASISAVFFTIMLFFTSGVYVLAALLILLGIFIIVKRPNFF